MKPTRTLAQTRTPDGALLNLQEHDGEYFIRLNGRPLMSTTMTESEEALADRACAMQPRPAGMRVLIGGLGLGYSLKRALELVGKDGVVHVAELLPEVVAWNREHLRAVNGRLLDDPRVAVFTEDVFALIRRAQQAPYHAILLDVDNGPTALVNEANSRIYSRKGLASLYHALHPGGRVAFWSATFEPLFTGQLARAGFIAEEFPARAHEHSRRTDHRIYLAARRADGAPAPAPAVDKKRVHPPGPPHRRKR